MRLPALTTMLAVLIGMASPAAGLDLRKNLFWKASQDTPNNLGLLMVDPRFRTPHYVYAMFRCNTDGEVRFSAGGIDHEALGRTISRNELPKVAVVVDGRSEEWPDPTILFNLLHEYWQYEIIVQPDMIEAMAKARTIRIEGTGLRLDLPIPPDRAEFDSFRDWCTWRAALSACGIEADPSCRPKPSTSVARGVDLAEIAKVVADRAVALLNSSGTPHEEGLKDRIGSLSQWLGELAQQERALVRLLEGRPDNILDWKADDRKLVRGEISGFEGAIRGLAEQIQDVDPHWARKSPKQHKHFQALMAQKTNFWRMMEGLEDVGAHRSRFEAEASKIEQEALRIEANLHPPAGASSGPRRTD